MHRLLVIFELDGTLVDSEKLGARALQELLPGLNDTVDELVIRYRGWKLAEILRDIERRNALFLAEDFEPAYRHRSGELFASDLRPMEGVQAMLEELAQPCCIASSGPPAKIAQALALTGLAPYFGNRVLSAYLVGSWKPEPGLFLHAAKAMGYAPQRCVVVEDSTVGLDAAAAAGMRALHCMPDGDADGGAGRFSNMAELPGIIRDLEQRPHAGPEVPA